MRIRFDHLAKETIPKEKEKLDSLCYSAANFFHHTSLTSPLIPIQ